MRKLNIWKKGLCAVCGLLTAGAILLQSGFVSMAYPESGVINDTGVNIRSTSDSGSRDNVMKKADQNMAVTILGEETGTDGNTWLKISYSENGAELIGYVREDFVTRSQDAGTVSEPDSETEGQETAGAAGVSKNPQGLMPIEGLDDGLTCYLDINSEHFYINQGFADDMIPDGFTRTEVDFRGNTIQAVKSNDIDFYLVYLTNYDDQMTSDWYVYDAEAQGFCYWIKLETMQGKYLYLLDTFGGAQMDFGYEETNLEIDGKMVQAWQLIMSDEEDLTGENKNFYYVFGINQDGNKGLYSYYDKDGTYQRNILTGLEIVDDDYLTTEENTKLLESQIKELKTAYTEGMSKRLTIICILVVVCVLLLFISIHMGLKIRRMSSDDEDDEDDDEEQEERPRFRKRGEPVQGPDERGRRSAITRLVADELDDDSEEEPAPEPVSVVEAEVTDQDEPEDSNVSFEDMDIHIEDIRLDGEEDDEEAGAAKMYEAGADEYSEYEDADEEEDADEYEDDEDEDEDEDDEEEVRPRRRGFFFGRHREDDEYDDEDEDDEYDDEDDEDEDEDDEEEVRPRRRGFFFGRRRDDEDDEYDEDDEEDEEDDEEEVSWAQSRRAAKEAKVREKEEARARRAREMAEANERKSARRSRYEDDDEEDALVRKANRKTKAADYAEKTVTAKKSSRVQEPAFLQDDEFEFEFIDLDDDL